MTFTTLGFAVKGDGAEKAAVDLDRFAASAGKAETAAKGLAATSQKLHVTSFNTANIAAQFQDIAVTSAMGMNWMQIGLQQGTQLAAVLGPMGLTGTVRSLGAAFLSVINPVSLLTIGAVSLAAAGIQAFGSMGHSAEDASEALKKHKEWLDQILAGYEKVRDAAGQARDAALKLPQGAVVSELQMDLEQQEQARRVLQERIDATKTNLSDVAALYADLGSKFPSDDGADVMGGIAAQLDALRTLGVSTASTREDLDQATVAASKLFAEADDPTVRDLANQVYTLAKQLRAATGEFDATSAAIKAMDRAAAQSTLLNGTFTALRANTNSIADQLRGMAPDTRTDRQRVADLYSANSGSDATGDLKKLRDFALAQIDLKEAQEASTRAARDGARATEQQREANESFTRSIQERIDKAEFEASVLGLSEDAVARLRTEFELLQEAARDGLTVDPKLLDQLVDGEQKTRQMTKALADQKKVMDQLASSAQTLLSSLLSATGLGDNPIAMGVESALGPLMKGDWIGAAIAGITGLFTGYIEMEKKHQEAIRAANDNKASINSFIGTGYGKEVNETAVALERYRKQAQQYIELAKAAGDQGLLKRLQAAAAAYKDTLKADAIRDRFRDAKDDLLEVYQAQADGLQTVIDRTKDFIATTEQFRDSLSLDKQFSPLNPQQMLAESQRQFDLLVKKAQLGDSNAQGRVSGAATSYLDAARGYLGSSQGYQDVFSRVQDALGTVVGSASTQLTAAQEQLAATNQSIAQLQGIQTGIQTIAAIMERLTQLQAEVSKLRGTEAKDLRDEIKDLKKVIRNHDLPKAA